MRRLIAVGATMLMGCGGWGFTEPKTPPIEPFATPPSDLAQVCVMRPHVLASAVTFAVKDNGRLVGATRGASYFCYFAVPGRHRITSEADDQSEAEVTFIQGARYYLHQQVKNTFGYVTSPLEWIAESDAHKMISKCDYRVVTEVPEGAVRPPVNPVAPAQP